MCEYIQELRPRGCESLKLRIAPGSSLDKICAAIDRKETCCVCIINHDVVVHHDSWHETLRESIAAEWSDSLGDGNFSMTGYGFVVVRWKSDLFVNHGDLGRLLVKAAGKLIAETFERRK